MECATGGLDGPAVGPADAAAAVTAPTAASAGRSFARTGAAARKPASSSATPSGSATPRRRRSTPAPATPVPVPVQPTLNGPADDAKLHLAVAVAALEEHIGAAVLAYRPEGLADSEWAEVADLVHLGMAAAAPRTREAVRSIGWALGVHARVHLRAGSSRTLAGWYGPDAVATSLAGGTFGRGKGAFTVPERFASSYAGRLGVIGRALVAGSPPPARKFGAYARQAPLSAAELEEVFDFCAAHGKPVLAQRLALLVWLLCGTGAKRADLGSTTSGTTGSGINGVVTGASVQVTGHAVVFTTAGPDPRRIPVLGACEAPVLDAAAAAGDAPLLELRDGSDLADIVITTGWRVADRFPLTAGRLRATWLAAVLAGGAPFAGVLTAAGLTGEKTFADLLARLPALDDVTYETGLRCAHGPLPVAGQLTLPGVRHPAPRLPLLPEGPVSEGPVRP